MSTILKKLIQRLRTAQESIAVAESCTGGLLSAELTKLPGSATWFERGLVTYSNEAKKSLLGVSEAFLQEDGAVSQNVAQAMAEGMLKNSQAQIALSITGIAGPTSDESDKPIGIVWFGLARQNKETLTVCKQFDGSRSDVRKQAVNFSLNWLYTML
jgi:nicotinamide-nucleotide amidase